MTQSQLRLSVTVTEDTATSSARAAFRYGPDDVDARTITDRRDATPPQVTAMTPLAPAGLWRLVSPAAQRRVRGRGRDVRRRCHARVPTTQAATAQPSPSPGRARTSLGTPAHRQLAFKYDATPPTVSLVRRSASRREGLVPEAGNRELRGHRRHVRDRGLHRADAVRRAGSVDRPRSSDRAATRPETQLRPARRSSTTRQPRRSRRRRPRSTRVSRASAGSAPATSSKSSSSAAQVSTAPSRRSSTEATALRSSTRP